MPVISVSECLTDMLKCLVCGVEGFLKVGFKAALYWKRKQKRYRWWADIVMFVGERRVMVMADGNFSGGCDNAHAIGQLEGRTMLEGRNLRARFTLRSSGEDIVAVYRISYIGDNVQLGKSIEVEEQMKWR